MSTCNYCTIKGVPKVSSLISAAITFGQSIVYGIFIIIYHLLIFRNAISGMAPFVFWNICSHHGMEWERSSGVEGRIFLKACLCPLWDPSWSLQTISSIVLYRFSTGLISGEFECQLAFRLKLSRFFLHRAWLASVAWSSWHAPFWTKAVYRLELHSFHLSCASVTILQQRRDIKRVHLQNRWWKNAMMWDLAYKIRRLFGRK